MRSPARLPALLALALLASGCLAPSGIVAPTAPAATTAVAHLRWTGTLHAGGGDLVPQPTPRESHAFTLAPGVTTLWAWANATDAQEPLGFRVLDATGEVLCGGSRLGCVAALPAPRGKEETASVVVFADSGGPARDVPFTIELSLSSASLAMLGPPAPFGSDAPVPFADPVVVSGTVHSDEPSLAVGPDGAVFVAAPAGPQQALWRSEDGRAFAAVPIHGQAQDPGSTYPLGGGDSDVAVATARTIYFVDQHGDAGESVSASHDGGKTWTTQVLAAGPPGVPTPLGEASVGRLAADRPWLVAEGDSTVWMAYNTPLGQRVARSLDGGTTWPLVTAFADEACGQATLARDPAGTLYLSGCDARGPRVGVSKDGGVTFAWQALATRSNATAGFYRGLDLSTTTDAAGNAYVVWSDGFDDAPEPAAAPGFGVWLVVSTDHGATWSKPRLVTGGIGNAVMPWATGGAPGHLAIAFYGTKALGHPGRLLGDWYPMLATTDDATAGNATFRFSAMSPHPVQYGPICLDGGGCVSQRNLGDFFQIQADAQGRIHAAFVDGTAGGSGPQRSTILYSHSLGSAVGGPSVDKNGGAG